MKRTLTLLLALLTCFSVILSMTACDSNPPTNAAPTTTAAPKHPIEAFAARMAAADSAQMVMTMYDLPFFGTITMVYKHDGNIDYTSGTILSEESYTETLDNVTYEYSKGEDGKWTKTQAEQSDEDEGGTDEFTKLMENPDNFELVEGTENTYKQKSNIVFDEFDDVTITIEENSCTIEMMISEDLTCRCKLVISHIGEVELTLPEVSE